jgi:hypothetical protein
VRIGKTRPSTGTSSRRFARELGRRSRRGVRELGQQSLRAIHGPGHGLVPAAPRAEQPCYARAWRTATVLAMNSL